MTFIVSTLTFETGLADWFKRFFNSMKPYGYYRAANVMHQEGYYDEARRLREMAKLAGE